MMWVMVENVDNVVAHEKLREARSFYSLMTVTDRALPSIVDGLKPSGRRVLYAAYTLGLKPSGKTVKSMKPVSVAMSEFHPHGDQSIYQTLVNLTSRDKVNLPLFFGQGSFGDLDNGAAAARYTEVKLSEAGWLCVEDVARGGARMVPNYDESSEEPEFLPVRFPVLAVNGSKGMAVGFACDHPSYNAGEVMDLCVLCAEKGGDVSLKDAVSVFSGPDFPTRGLAFVDDSVLSKLLFSGDGGFVMRGEVSSEILDGGKPRLNVLSLPAGGRKEPFINAIKGLIEAGVLDQVQNIIDLSGKESPFRLCVDLKAGSNIDEVLGILYAKTPLQANFNVNGMVIDDGIPVKVGLLGIVSAFIDARKNSIRASSLHERGEREKRLRVVDGLVKVLLDVDKAVSIIRSSRDSDIAKTKLMKEFKIDDVQASSVLSLQLRTLTRLSSKELKIEQKDLKARIKVLDKIIKDDKHLVETVLIPELKETKKIINTPRRTIIKPVTELTTINITATKPKTLETFNLKNGRITTGKTYDNTKELYAITLSGKAGKIDNNKIANGTSDIFHRATNKEEILNICDNKTKYSSLTDDLHKIKTSLIADYKTGLKPLNKEETKLFTPLTKNTRYIIVCEDGRVHKADPNTVNPQGIAGTGVKAHGDKIGKIVTGMFCEDNDILYTKTNDSLKLTRIADIPVKGRGSNGVMTHLFRKADKKIVSAKIVKEGTPTGIRKSGEKI